MTDQVWSLFTTIVLYFICISSVFPPYFHPVCDPCREQMVKVDRDLWPPFSFFDAFEARKSQRAAAVLTLSSNIGLDMYTLFSNYIRFQSKTFLILLLLLIATFQFHVATQLGHKGSFSTGLHQTEIIDMYETNLN